MKNEKAIEEAQEAKRAIPIAEVDTLALLKEALIEGFGEYVDPVRGRVTKASVVEYVNALIGELVKAQIGEAKSGSEPVLVDRDGIDVVIPAKHGSTIFTDKLTVHVSQTPTEIGELLKVALADFLALDPVEPQGDSWIVAPEGIFERLDEEAVSNSE